MKVEIKEESYEETEFKAEPLSDDDDLEDFLWQPDQDQDSDSGTAPQNNGEATETRSTRSSAQGCI